MDGMPNFNYRCMIPFKNTYRADKRLHISCWDRDLIGSNDSIGSNTIDLTAIIHDVLATKKEFVVNRKYYDAHLASVDEWSEESLHLDWYDRDSFWIPIYEKEGFKK